MLAKQFDKVFIDSISNALNVQVVEWYPSVAIKIYRRRLDFVLFQLSLIADVFGVHAVCGVRVVSPLDNRSTVGKHR